MNRWNLARFRGQIQCWMESSQGATEAGTSSVSPNSTRDPSPQEIPLFTIRPSRQTGPRRNVRPRRVTRSALSVYLELMYNIGVCPHPESSSRRISKWKKAHDVSQRTIPNLPDSANNDHILKFIIII